MTTVAPKFVCFCLLVGCFPDSVGADESKRPAATLINKFCCECHNSDDAEAGLDLEGLIAQDTFASEFRNWRKVVEQLQQNEMPPQSASEKPTPLQRQQLIAWVKERIDATARKHEGDPGRVVIRRLTSAEYGYAIADLTGLNIDIERDFVSDAVGGAGFTNTGIVQFTQDSTLERYLEAAKQVADHAVIGTGPLLFFPDAGRTGFELSAIDRIQKIYRNHGFRTAAGEGGEPFGLEMHPKAFFVAWRFQHRRALGEPDTTLKSLAMEAGIDARFAEYIFGILTRPDPSFPMSKISEAWRNLPLPDPSGRQTFDEIRSGCEEISQLLHDWQNRFGSNTDAKEEAPVLRADLFAVKQEQQFEMNINWPKGTKTAHLLLTVESANRNGTPDAVILWKEPQIQFRDYEKRREDPKPLRDYLAAKTVSQLRVGQHPRGGEVEPTGFVTVGTKPVAFELPIPEGARSARLLVTGELDLLHGEDCIVRCTIAQAEETDQGKSVSGLLSNPESVAFESWKEGVLEFARIWPQMSQREPAPSDRDPIPAPFDTTYNNPQRNFFHTHIKYFRDDEFLVKNILNDETRQQLDRAWADLLTSFDFHDTWLQSLARKYSIELNGRQMADVNDVWIATTPTQAQSYLRTLKADFDQKHAMLRSAESRHLSEVAELAARSWRRPLRDAEAKDLQVFYQKLRDELRLDHRSAISTLIARVLTSPSFLYRAEHDTNGASETTDKAVPLSQWELASRLSFFLWSSVSDDELRRAADAGALETSDQLAAQARRMMLNPKSRRFSTEFFGQWFGFYRFHQFRGIDSERFPEFSESLRKSMYDEAIEFFDFIVRRDRPVSEILFADYSFVNQELAAHYGLELDSGNDSQFRRLNNLGKNHRGGLLRLGAILATTSAPRRTSPVKRGDWILRRVLGTAVPPPPADAGSIAADEVVGDGFSILQRLEAHRRDASCSNCHARFDALGFALENYDSLGRWREQYRDSKPVQTNGTLRGGTEISGIDGLHKYLSGRQDLFHKTLAQKLLGYALGRRDSIGDVPLVDDLKEHMKNDGGMRGLVERIVTSRQFRYHQGTSATQPIIE